MDLNTELGYNNYIGKINLHLFKLYVHLNKNTKWKI